MPYIVSDNSSGHGALSGEEYLLIAPVTADGITGKRLPQNCLVKHVIVKCTGADIPHLKFGTSPGGEEFIYDSAILEFKEEVFSEFHYMELNSDLYVTGVSGTGAVLKILIIYQRIRL